MIKNMADKKKRPGVTPGVLLNTVNQMLDDRLTCYCQGKSLTRRPTVNPRSSAASASMRKCTPIGSLE